MAGTPLRRVIAPLSFILALSLVTGLVWYRILHRDPAKTVTATVSPAIQHCRVVSDRPAKWPAPRQIELSVLNATNRSGLAASVATALKARGFGTLKPGNSSASLTATQIRYGTRFVTQARLVHYYLPGSTLVSSTSTSATIEVSVGSSYRALATPAAVSAAKRSAAPVRTC